MVRRSIVCRLAPLLFVGCCLQALAHDTPSPAVPAPDPPRRLSERGLTNLTAFSRLLGYVRYFHPSDEAAAADWHLVAVEGMRAVEDAGMAEELADRLSTFFRPLAPTLQVFPDARPEPRRPLLPPGFEPNRRTYWIHRGCGIKDATPVFESRRVIETLSSPPAAPAPDLVYEADLGGGVHARIPLVLWGDAGGTRPEGSPAFGAGPASTPFNANDRATRLAAVALAWNVFQHFYPSFDRVDTDWGSVLTASLLAAATDADAVAFEQTLARMVAVLNDGYGDVLGPGTARSHAPPIDWAWVDGRLVLTGVAPSAQRQLHVGDVVTAIDGVPVTERLAQEAPFVSAATAHGKRQRLLHALRFGLPGSTLTLDVERVPELETPPFQITLTRRLTYLEAPRTPRPEPLAELTPGVFYVDLTRLDDSALTAALPRLERARSVIFDLRGRTLVRPTFVSHLIKTPIRTAPRLVPIVRRPNRERWTFAEAPARQLAPASPYLEGQRFVLIDERTIGPSEAILDLLTHYGLAHSVGQPTAGSDGSLLSFELPGSYRILWTGTRALHPDGTPFRAGGSQPDLPVDPTLEGIRTGRDEILERALYLIVDRWAESG